MPVTVNEQYGRRLDRNRAEVTYLIRGTHDASETRTALLTEAPGTLHAGAYVREDADVNEIRGLDGYIGNVIYLRPEIQVFEPPAVGETIRNFDTGGGQVRRYSSYETVGAYGNDANVADNGNLIGVTDQGIEGADIVIPQYQFSETKVFTPAQVTNAYRTILFGLTGRTNNAAFRGLNEGECLFLGASGSQRGDDNWELTFNFAGSPNVTGLAIGGITAIAKKGWEYLWVRYVDAEANGVMTRVPHRVYVERVYLAGDFSTLGLDADE